MKFIYDVYMVLSYAMITGCAIAFIRDSADTRYSFWAYVGALFWPVTACWMIWESFRDYQREMSDE